MDRRGWRSANSKHAVRRRRGYGDKTTNRLTKKAQEEIESAVFTCATTECGYNDSFELFRVAVPPGGGDVVRVLKKDTTINATKFKRGRRTVFCRDLNRWYDAANLRTGRRHDSRRRGSNASMGRRPLRRRRPRAASSRVERRTRQDSHPVRGAGVGDHQ